MSRFNTVHPGPSRISKFVHGAATIDTVHHGTSRIIKPGWTGTLNRDSENGALVLIPDSTDMRPGLLSRLSIHHWTFQNELTVRYAQNDTPLKIPTYPNHSDNYSLAIKFNILGLSKFPFLLEEAI